MTKNTCWIIRFSAIAHLSPGTYQRAPITASLENVPDSETSAYRQKYYHLFTQSVLNAHIRKNSHY